LTSCSARLTVYALFIGAFFPVGGQNLVLGLYLLGILAAIFTGLILKNTILQGEAAPFIMELPPYHIPKIKGLLLRAGDRLKAFITKAGIAIVIMVIVLGFMNSVGTDGTFGKQDSKDSILSAMSRTVTPVFTPMGITNVVDVTVAIQKRLNFMSGLYLLQACNQAIATRIL
jgi:ferrous iron transport protein B